MKFKSNYSSLRLILEPSKTITDGRKKIIQNGVSVEFKDGIFVTKDKDLIAKLKSLKNYGLDFKSVEKKVEPKSVKPASRKVAPKKLETKKVVEKAVKKPAKQAVKKK